MEQLQGSSFTYRIAVGPQQGRKVFTLQAQPACDEPFDDGVGKVAGFSLHAGVAARADQRQKLERLCRYINRPAISEKRLSLTPNGNVRYQLKTPYRDGTTHVIFEPLDNIAWSDVGPPQAGPKGGGQDARSTALPGWQPWCRNRGSLPVKLTRFARIILILARFAGPPKRSKYVPDVFFTGSSRRTASTARG